MDVYIGGIHGCIHRWYSWVICSKFDPQLALATLVWQDVVNLYNCRTDVADFSVTCKTASDFSLIVSFCKLLFDTLIYFYKYIGSLLWGYLHKLQCIVHTFLLSNIIYMHVTHRIVQSVFLFYSISLVGNIIYLIIFVIVNTCIARQQSARCYCCVVSNYLKIMIFLFLCCS